MWGVRGRTLSHPRLAALWAGCWGRCGVSGVGRSPTPDCPPSGRAVGAGVGRPGLDALPPPTARPLGGLPGPVWGVRGRALSQPDCSPSGRAAGDGVGRPGSDALPPPTARPLGGLPVPVWGVQGRARSHPRLPALWAGCRGRCGASGVGRSPTPDSSPSGRGAGAGVGRPGLDALPAPTARSLGGLLGPVSGVRGRALSHPRLLALWAGCRGRCGASGVGRSPIPDCPPSGRAAGAGVGRPGSGALPPPTPRPLSGLPGPVWGVQGRALSHPRLPALWAGCRGRCGASGVGRSPTADCPPSGRAAGAGAGRPGSDALPFPTARPLGGLPGPVWGVPGRAHFHLQLPALWAGCRGRCGASGVKRSPSPDCPPSGRAAGAGVGHPGWGGLPAPTARPLGELPGAVWGVRGRTLSHPRLPALWAGCRGRYAASGVVRSPPPDCSPSERAAGAGVGRPGSGAFPPPTARALGGLLGPVWGLRGRTLSRPRLPALWAGCRGRCGASGVGPSPTPDCSPSWRAAGAGSGRPGSDALQAPTARPLGGLPEPVWGVRVRARSHPRLPAHWAGTGAGVGRPGSGALPPPTARPLGGLPGPLWGVRGRTLSHPRLAALWAGCRGQCGASGVGRSPTPDCSPSGRAAGAGVGRPGSNALPPPTARPLGGLPGLVWGVRGRALSHSRLPALWAGCRGRCGAFGVGRTPTPDCPPSGRAAGAGVGRPGSGALPPPTACPLGGLPGPVWGVRGRRLSHPRLPALWVGCWGRCGASESGALPPPTARPLGGLPGPLWGVQGRTLSHHRLPALWAGCRVRCRASGVGRSASPDSSSSGRAAGAGVGPPGSDVLPPPTARPLGGLPGPVWGVRGRALSHPWAAVRMRALLGRVGRAGLPGAFWCPSPFLWPFLLRPPLVRPPPGWGCPVCGCCWVFLPLVSPPPLVFFFFFFPAPPPSVRPVVSCFACFPASGALGLRVLLPPPPPSFFRPPPLPVVSGISCFPVAFGLCAPPPPPPPLFFSLSCCVFSCFASAVCVLGCRAVCSLSCPFVVLCASSVLFLVAGVVGSWCRCLLSGVCWWLWLPGVVVWWCVSALVPVSGLAVAGRPPCGVPFPCAVSCGVVLPCGAVPWCPVFFFFFCFSPCWWRWLPVVPRWFWAPGRFRVVTVSVLCLCGAVLVCLRRCSLFGALLPSRGWLVFCVVACCVCVFAVGPGCPLLSLGGSWWLLVSCLGGVLWCVPWCCAATCCCALCRLALRCCALCCFVLLRLVLPRAVLCPGALSFVLGSCAFWRRVLSCPPALCVVCCGVSLRGVVRRCALCGVSPGVSCCAFLVVSALCGVAVRPALPRCPASLCCAPWCFAAPWCRGVLSCRLAGFVSCVGVVVPT